MLTLRDAAPGSGGAATHAGHMSRLGWYAVGALAVAAATGCGYPTFTFDGTGGGGGSGGGSLSSSSGLTCEQVSDVVGCCNTKLSAVTYCNAAGTVVVYPCAKGTVCGWVASDLEYECVSPPGGADPLGVFPQFCP